MISKEIPERSWYQDKAEPVDTRRIYARWSNDGKTKSYAVYLMIDGDKAYFNANVLPDGTELFGEGGILVQAPGTETDMVTVDMTEIFKQNPNGGIYQFTVQPQIEGVETEPGKSSEITALAVAKNLRWDENYTTAIWDPIDGADYYLLWLYVGGGLYKETTGKELSDACDLEPYGDSGSCVIVKDVEADLTNVLNAEGEIYFKIGGYSENIEKYYTPLYELSKSETI